MRRMLALLLCLCLTLPATAQPPKYVALTFDDGPSGRFTRQLLEGLGERQVKATFLLCGYRMAQDPDLAGRIFAEGHEIGLHGYSHNCMACMTGEQIRRELANTVALLPKGCTCAFLRPPGGVVSGTVKSVAQEQNLAILSWNVDPRDWATHDAGQVARAVVDKVHDGDVILLHDMSDSSVDAALTIIDSLQEKGYQFVTASQLAALRGITLEPGKTYSRFPATDITPSLVPESSSGLWDRKSAVFPWPCKYPPRH